MQTAKKNILVLIANASEARTYQTARLGEKMELTHEFKHPESRKKGIDLVSDRPGHYKSHGTGHGALIEPTAPKEVEREQFALFLAKELENERNGNFYQQLVIIAPPHFHGLIRKYSNNQVQKRIIHDLEKDYTKLPEKMLLKHLSDLHRPVLAA